VLRVERGTWSASGAERCALESMNERCKPPLVALIALCHEAALDEALKPQCNLAEIIGAPERSLDLTQGCSAVHVLHGWRDDAWDSENPRPPLSVFQRRRKGRRLGQIVLRTRGWTVCRRHRG
jgi:hypothetical protein